jgi:predicted Zn-dependent protease
MELLSAPGQPSNVENLVTRIQLLFDRGDPNSSRQALQLLEQLKQLRPLSWRERMTLAILYERIDNWPAARDEMLALLGQTDADQSVYITFIEMLLRRNAAAEAATWLETYRSKWPQTTLPVALLAARTINMQGRGPQAEAFLMSLLPAQRPLPKDKWPVLQTLAGYYDRTGFHPGYLAEIGRNDSVEKLLRELAGYEPEQNLALVNWLAQRGKIDAVLDFIDQNREKMAPPQILQLCMVAIRKSANPATPKQTQRVEAWFDRVRRDDPDSLQVQMFYADLLDFERRFDEVEKIYRAILARSDLSSNDRGAVLNNLSFLLAMRGEHPDEAAKLIDEALNLFGPQSDVLDTHGVVYLSKGDVKQAISDLTDAVIVTDPKPIQFVHLAMAQTAANNITGARKSMDRAKSMNFNPDELSPLEKTRYQSMLNELGISSS